MLPRPLTLTLTLIGLGAWGALSVQDAGRIETRGMARASGTVRGRCFSSWEAMCVRVKAKNATQLGLELVVLLGLGLGLVVLLGSRLELC